MSRDEQLELNRFITDLLKSKYKETFWTKLQGGDTAKTLVVISNNKKVIGRIHNYLINDLNLVVADGTKKHGNGGNFTRLINLSEIDIETIKQIKRKVDLNNRRIMKKEPIIMEKRLVKPIIPVAETPKPLLVHEIPGVVKIEKDHDLKSLISYITWMLKFEGVSSKSFLCDKMKEGEYCITCNSTDDAEKVHMYLSWLVGDPSLVVTEKKVVIVDYKKKIKKEKSLERFIFCLPPSGRVNSEEIKRRLLRVSVGSRPNVSSLSESKFIVTYVRSNFAEKVFSVLLSMGWKVEDLSKSSFIVSVAGTKELVSPVSEDQTANVLEMEEVSMPSTNRDQFDLEVAQNPSNLIFGVESKEEALVELEKLFSDTELFIKLSPETQQRIIDALKEEARKRNPEEYALNLLSIIGK